MSDCTPTTEEIRRGYITGDTTPAEGRKFSDVERIAGAEFDRWLTQHDAEVAAKVLRDHGKRVAYWHRDRSPRVVTYSAGMIVADLEEYADRIEREAGVR